MIELFAIESSFSHLLQGFSSPQLDVFFKTVTIIGDPILWFTVVAFLYWKGEERKSFFFATTLIAAAAFVGVLKEIISRPRPDPNEFIRITGASGYSMPSGHAAISASVLGHFWKGSEAWMKPIGAAIVALVMVSRAYLGVHYLSDVIVGAIIGFAIGYALLLVHVRIEKMFSQNTQLELAVNVIMFLFTSAVFLATNSQMAYALCGYFAGSAILHAAKWKQKRPDNELFAKLLAGFAGLGLLFHFSRTLYFSWMLFFLLAGLWVSIIFPLLWDIASVKFYRKSARSAST